MQIRYSAISLPAVFNSHSMLKQVVWVDSSAKKLLDRLSQKSLYLKKTITCPLNVSLSPLQKKSYHPNHSLAVPEQIDGNFLHQGCIMPIWLYREGKANPSEPCCSEGKSLKLLHLGVKQHRMYDFSIHLLWAVDFNWKLPWGLTYYHLDLTLHTPIFLKRTFNTILFIYLFNCKVTHLSYLFTVHLIISYQGVSQVTTKPGNHVLLLAIKDIILCCCFYSRWVSRRYLHVFLKGHCLCVFSVSMCVFVWYNGQR